MLHIMTASDFLIRFYQFHTLLSTRSVPKGSIYDQCFDVAEFSAAARIADLCVADEDFMKVKCGLVAAAAYRIVTLEPKHGTISAQGRPNTNVQNLSANIFLLQSSNGQKQTR